MSLVDSENNVKKKGLLTKIVDSTFLRILRKGFYGEMQLTVSVEDGSIQDIAEQVTEKHKAS